MNKKKWALLILSGIIIFACIKLFYKTYNKTGVAKSADCIVVIDVKRVINTLIWNYITTPSQWKIGKLFSKKVDDGKISVKDMFALPDYAFAFHSKGQPANTWYTLLTIKDKKDFEKGLQQFEFAKLNEHEYQDSIHGIRLYINNDKVLVSNTALEDAGNMATIAAELFTQKAYISKDILATAIKAKSHLAVYIAPNNFLQTAAVIAANFDKEKIEISSLITPFKQYSFAESNFNYSSTSLSTAGFTQPSPSVYSLLNKDKISAALNVNADSVFLQSNKSYSLDITDIKQRIDSAISYTYDDEFNKVEKVVVNNLQEPSFNFTITGDGSSSIYNYLQRSNKIEKTAAGDLFTPMPLVKSYCSIQNQNQLAVTASNYKAMAEDKSINAIFFLNLALTKIPANLQRYLPDNIIQAISNIATVKVSATKNNEQVLLSAVFEKMKNDLPVIKF